MSKGLTNRQLGEALGYALEKTEKNIKQVASKLESERIRIEAFRVDTNSVERAFKDANEAFRKTSELYTSELKKIQNTKPKWVQVKDWMLTGALILLLVIVSVFAFEQYQTKNDLKNKSEELEKTFYLLQKFFNENPKQEEAFEKWNK